jgi:acetyltransferase-like isoleucine patch superfamily enzyme
MTRRSFDRLYDFSGRHPRLRGLLAALARFCGRNDCRVRGRNNEVERFGAFLRDVRIDVEGEENRVQVMPGVRLEKVRIVIRGTGHRLVVGSDCRVRRSVFWMEDREGFIELGPDTTVEEASFAVAEDGRSLIVGRDCMLAYDVDIRTSDSHAIFDRDGGARLNPAADVRIGDHVWLGAHVQVQKGVRIGADSVVGARSVVGRDIPESCLAAGVPAEVRRENIRWTRKR